MTADDRQRRDPLRDPLRLDPKSVRRTFERAAATYDSAAVLQREIGQRMADRLALVKLQPAAILDAGCGTGDALAELRTRFPAAFIVGLDLAHAMLVAARRRATAGLTSERSLLARLFGSRAHASDEPALVCADACRLPLAGGSFDLIWSNLTLQWINEPATAFAEFHRALRVGGLLTFTTFGPDTLGELRTAFAGVDRATHVNRFIDMHDLGDMLVNTGFAEPVMDMEKLTLTYADATSLMRDLKAIGAHNATMGRPRGLTGRARWRRMLDALEAFRREGRLPATFEVVYGHAWKPEPRVAADGRAIVRFAPRAAR
ncbi:MAG: malonyl-ACP O-methyltransferase BioC [Betaproteobacteria bacterium]|nr:MAG: malonyl-ACP O-methyltransferase BioC [Betaproteobacteria bacterium]